MDTTDERPLLGLATTYQLLEEVAVRMEMTAYERDVIDLSELRPYPESARRLARAARRAQIALPQRLLVYRTVDQT